MELNQFGKRIKRIRQSRKETAYQVSQSIGKDRSYLSNIEAGRERPSLSYFQSLISHYSISKELALELASFVGYKEDLKMLGFDRKTRREVENEIMDDRNVKIKDAPSHVEVKLDPVRTPVLYSDSVFITSNPLGIVFNIAQQIDDKNQQIIARIGMSRDHAEKLAEVLGKHLAITYSNPKKQ